jgi:uncharacterized membrane protein YciS (DUF1049 family)
VHIGYTIAVALGQNLSSGGLAMAWLEKRSGLYRIKFRYGGQNFQHSLKTDNDKEVLAAQFNIDCVLCVLFWFGFALAVLAGIGAGIEALQNKVRKEETEKQRKLAEQHKVALAEQAERLKGELIRAQMAAEAADAEAEAVRENTHREIQKYQEVASAAALKPDEIETAIERRLLLQYRQGRVMNVKFIAGRSGRLLIEWEVKLDGGIVPVVAGYRNGREIFSEHAFTGVHGDQIRRGRRYDYRFKVTRDGRPVEKPDEFHFEVIVPTPAQWDREIAAAEKSYNLSEWERRKQQILEKAQGFINAPAGRR